MWVSAAAAAKSLQLCLTLCGPIDSSPLGSSVPAILQARILEWAAISFSNARKWKVKVKSLSCARPLATPWTAACQASLSMGFSRQEYWSELPLSSPVGVSAAAAQSLQSCPTHCDPMNCSTPGLPVPLPTLGVHSYSFPSSQWCHPAISSSVIPFSSCPNPSQHQGLFQWVDSSHQVAKVLEFQL